MAARETFHLWSGSTSLASAFQMLAMDWYELLIFHFSRRTYATGFFTAELTSLQRGTDYVSSWPSALHVGAR